MKISLNWIKDYVNLDGIEVSELLKRFTLSTAEIEGYEIKGENTYGVVFAKIIDVQPHPLSQKLHILKVDKGDDILQIVCGAPNVRIGMITCLATIGSCVNGTKIKIAKLAGVESFGMCCGENELGIGSDESGIIDVDENVEIGADIKKYWPIDDVIIEVDNKSLTNRPDLWGHYGLAREFSAIFDRPLKNLQLDDIETYNKLPKINIDVNTNDCFRYSALSVSNITKTISSRLLKIRLNYIDQRDINLLADLTNYVMFDISQPMHAFDNKKVKSIYVSNSKKGETLLTLEKENHPIPENTITVYDQNKEPVALAGIKGGLNASINDETTSLLLESATFDSAQVRKSSIALGLRTQSSLRYEKTLDPELTTVAIARFLYLLKQIDPKVVVTSSISDVYKKHYDKITLNLSVDFLSSRIGFSIDKVLAIKYLKALGFGVKEDGVNLQLEVPSFRATKDVSNNEDIVEEVARMIGYDNIKPLPMSSLTTPIKQNKIHTSCYDTKMLLAHKYGLNEIHTYVWNYYDFNNSHCISQHPVLNLLDSSNSGQSGIRTRLLPSLIKVFDENKNNLTDIGIFEIGSVVDELNKSNLANEKQKLAILVSSTTKTQEELYFELKGMLLDITNNIFGKTVKIGDKCDCDLLHPINSCKILNTDGKELGYFGISNPKLRLDKKHNIALLEVEFALLDSGNDFVKNISEVSKYQEVALDFNFMVKKETLYREIEESINQFRCNYNMSFNLKDIYNDNNTPDFLCYTFNVRISSRDHTLTGKEIDSFSSRFVSHMKTKGFELKQ